MANLKKGNISFDEAMAINIPEFRGASPLNSGIWLNILCDLAEGLYHWDGNLNFYDLLKIEKLIFKKANFALIRTKHKKGKAIIIGGFHIFEVAIINSEINQQKPLQIRIIENVKNEHLVKTYNIEDFVFFDNFTYTIPYTLAQKYSEVLAKLDALYMQNIDKLSIPVIGIGMKNLKNELLNIFKRTKLNALYTLVTGNNENRTMKDAFFNPQIDFILDKVNKERETIMKEYLQNLGINPNKDILSTSQYVNEKAITETSLINKYFSASLNNYRQNFCDKVMEKFGITLNFKPTVGGVYESL